MNLKQKARFWMVIVGPLPLSICAATIATILARTCRQSAGRSAAFTLVTGLAFSSYRMSSFIADPYDSLLMITGDPKDRSVRPQHFRACLPIKDLATILPLPGPEDAKRLLQTWRTSVATLETDSQDAVKTSDEIYATRQDHVAIIQRLR
jgi:hypothetical protein